MAEEANVPASVDATSPVEEPTRSPDAVAEPAVAEAKPAEDGVIATSEVAEVPANDAPQDDAAVKEDATADAQADTVASDDADAAPSSDLPATNGTPAPKKTNNGKRKSGAGVPEHKKKTPAKKGKKEVKLNLDVNPGDMHMVSMRGYQPWPVIVCDEEMLPESLLSKRPVSAKRIDGTYRDDFLEGGKNAKDRRYPIMFLGTNEFAWQVNTDLGTFNLEEVKKEMENGNQQKKTKALSEAYRIAVEGHDLAWFKEMLHAHEHAMQEDHEQREQKETQKAEKAEKAAKRKSTAANESEDVDMEDAGDDAAPSAKKAKANKKRKKGDESDGENEKPAKTPKAKLKLTAKTPKDTSAAKPKKEPKSKKKASEEAEPVAADEPPMTEEEALQKREKQILYLRHRLQKGFLARDQAPKDEDMSLMSDYLKQLEVHDDLEAEVIKKTKVHKVLKAIIKLETIPMEEDFNFKKRSNELLGKWSNSLANEAAEPAVTTEVDPAASNEAAEPVVANKIDPAASNGVEQEDREKSESTKEETLPAEKPAEGDVAMSEADKEVINDAPAAQADVEASIEDADKA
jgi:hypothetical protein